MYKESILRYNCTDIQKKSFFVFPVSVIWCKSVHQNHSVIIFVIYSPFFNDGIKKLRMSCSTICIYETGPRFLSYKENENDILLHYIVFFFNQLLYIILECFIFIYSEVVITGVFYEKVFYFTRR